MSIEEDIPAIFLDKVSPNALKTIAKTKKFVDEYCIPGDKLYLSQIDEGKRWTSTPEIVEKLKAYAKKQGIWNMFLSSHYKEGPGFTNLEYGLMAQYLGRSFVAPEATNTNAPDTGNMELFAKFGTPIQKKKWLIPLMEGTIRSAFLMTERGVSSSDALNISCAATRNAKGNYVLNGLKWFASGAGDPRTCVWLVMCKTGSTDSSYRNHSVLIVDAKKAIASGRAKILRPMSVFGYDDAPHGHMEISFDDYEIDELDMNDCILGSEGRGFELIQARLGAGRIHHCMRLIGAGEYALMRIAHRAKSRTMFGKPLALRETFLTSFAEHRIAIERCKLLVLNAAYKIDRGDSKQAKREIAIAKIETPRTILKIIDWCIQMYGAEGVSQDTELARMYAHVRTLRIADGPDEAHIAQLARSEGKAFSYIDEYFEKHDKRVIELSKL